MPTAIVQGTGLALLGWLALERFHAGALIEAGLAFSGGALGLIGCALVRARTRSDRNRQQATILAVVERCAVDRRAARCGPQLDADVQPLAQAVDSLLDRMAHVETTSRAVVNSARDAIVTINHRGLVQTFNPAAEQMFGYPSAAIIGHNVARLMPEVHARRHDDYIARYLDTGVAKVLSFPREEIGLRADGATFPISLYVTRIDTGGTPLFCGIIRDITEQQQTEREVLLHAMQIEQTNVELAQAKFEAEDARTQAEGANRSKSEFLANMSHEIRTPMTAILGFTENLLTEKLAEDDRRQALETIRRNGEHLMTLINDILDLSKIEAGRLTIERIAFSPIDLVAEVASLMRVRADAKKLQLRIDYRCPLPATVQSDPTRLRQVLINLSGNAIKFTESGAITIRVAMASNSRGQPLLQFGISDTGIGLTTEQMQRLFRPFEQADSSTTRRFGGSGLGLNISKRLVEKLGGTIEVRSEPGQGSTFSFTIDPGRLDGVPMVRDASEGVGTRAAEPLAPQEPSPSRIHGRILLAEDGPDNQRLIRFLLEKAGAEVAVVGDGKAAVISALTAANAGTPFDIVLMDMQMPILDGYRATGELRQRGYKLPIVALTANAMAGDRERCIQAGCDDFAPKPVDRRALIATIARLLPAGAPAPAKAPSPPERA